MNTLGEGLRDLLGRGERGPSVTREGDALVIDCRGCRLTPVVHSEECIRCMVGAMCDHGGADRVVLRTGRDTEVSGSAARALRETASVRRWSVRWDPPGIRCRACPVSRERVMGAVWGAFPRGAVAGGRDVLAAGAPPREECARCLAGTSAALDRVDEGLRRVMDGMESGRGAVDP